jgi:hypothetical protein
MGLLAAFIPVGYKYTAAVAANCRTSLPQQTCYLAAIIMSGLLSCAFATVAVAEIGGGKEMVQTLRRLVVDRNFFLTTLEGLLLANQLTLCAVTVAVWSNCHSGVHMVAAALAALGLLGQCAVPFIP